MPADQDHDERERTGLAGAAGVAGDPATEEPDAPHEGSDADETGWGSAGPGGVADTLTDALTHSSFTPEYDVTEDHGTDEPRHDE